MRAGAARRPALRLVEDATPCVADVAMFYGERSGGIRTYLREKSAYAARSGALEHHVVVPGRVEWHDGGWHELRALRVAASNGYRIPLGVGALKSALRAIAPDVVLLHDPFWGRLGVSELARELGARVVAVHHGSSRLNAAGLPGPRRVYELAFRALLRRAYARADGVMAAVDPGADSRGAAVVPLRFGVDPAFRPRPALPRRAHVLYAGRLGREKGLFELLEATARFREPWRLHLVGTGPAERLLASRARRLGIADRVLFLPWVRDRTRLARLYAEASCVAMPGAHETFGLVCLEAAASGGSVVACRSAPSASVVGDLAETFPAGDPDGLLAAIERARRRRPDLHAAATLADAHTWDRAFEAELRDLARVRA